MAWVCAQVKKAEEKINTFLAGCSFRAHSLNGDTETFWQMPSDMNIRRVEAVRLTYDEVDYRHKQMPWSVFKDTTRTDWFNRFAEGFRDIFMDTRWF